MSNQVFVTKDEQPQIDAARGATVEALALLNLVEKIQNSALKSNIWYANVAIANFATTTEYKMWVSPTRD